MAGDWSKAKTKMTEGAEWRGTATVALGDITVDLGHRLLHERELVNLEQDIDKEALQKHKDSDLGEAQDRLVELQQKDELTEEEEGELQGLSDRVKRQQSKIMSSMGSETYDAFMDAGKDVLVPTEEDIQDVFSLDVGEQEQRFGEVPSTKEDVERLLKEEMQEVVEGQPYPVKFTIGLQAFAESRSLMGNQDQQT